MSTNFPGSLDTSTTIPAESASTPLSTNHVTAHQNIQDALEAVEAKVGADSSAVTTSHDYKLSLVTTTDKALPRDAAATTTNKILGTGTAITLGSDAEGDTYYRTSGNVLARLPRGADNQILKMNGNVPNWEVEATVSAATESAEGISRLATAAQITAGTASESGFPLVVTPDQLALSAPTFNAINTTYAPGLISQTTTPQTSSVANTTENTLYTVAIPANTLGTSRAIRVRANGTWAGNVGGRVLTLRGRYGSTEIVAFALTDATSSATGSWRMEFTLFANAATNAQRGRGLFTQNTIVSSLGASTTQFYVTDSKTLTEDSTTALNMTITTQLNSTSQPPSITVDNMTVEVV